jgi:hypothetical protein
MSRGCVRTSSTASRSCGSRSRSPEATGTGAAGVVPIRERPYCVPAVSFMDATRHLVPRSPGTASATGNREPHIFDDRASPGVTDSSAPRGRHGAQRARRPPTMAGAHAEPRSAFPELLE